MCVCKHATLAQQSTRWQDYPIYDSRSLPASATNDPSVSEYK